MYVQYIVMYITNSKSDVVYVEYSNDVVFFFFFFFFFFF